MACRPPPDSQESAWIWTLWGRKLDLFLVPESGTKIGPGRGHLSKDYYHGAGNWTRFWCRNPAPKLVPDSAPDHDPKAKPSLPLKGNPSPASLRPVCRLGGGACHSKTHIFRRATRFCVGPVARPAQKASDRGDTQHETEGPLFGQHKYVCSEL